MIREYKIQVKMCNTRRYFLDESSGLLFPHLTLPKLVWSPKVQSQLKPCCPVIPGTEHSNVDKWSEWPPQPPGLNPMDYSVWDLLTKKAYAGRTEKCTEPESKDKTKEKWNEISVAEIRKSLSTWKKRLWLDDSKGGSNIDHLFD